MFGGMKPRERAARSQALAEQVGLSDRLRHLPRELSGGQMQRAAIARALLNSPTLLLADEPTGNLDSSNAESIFKLFREICETQGTTVVVVTHDKDLARLADRTVAMSDGRIV
jgi:ABC-type lipoprotein export system ATPase subunit